MNSEVTLTNYSTSLTLTGQIRLVYKRSDPCNAILLENEVPRYFLATSEDGMRKFKISDTDGKAIVEVERRTIVKDTFKFADRFEGKAIKVSNILRETTSTSDGQNLMALETLDGLYYWQKIHNQRWTLYEESSSARVAWTEYVPGSGPTWALIVNSEVESILDYILASFFYVKFEPDGSGNSDSPRSAYLSTK